ncbi:AraC family transcriptional regulator [Chitinophaga lutea]
MKRYIQHEDLKLSHFTANEWEHPEHNHNHYELIFIHAGSGRHFLSGFEYPYGPGDIFLLSPCDFHRFGIAERTTFSIIKFHHSYLRSGAPDHVVGTETSRLAEELFLRAHSRQPPLSKPDAARAAQLVTMMTEEKKGPLFFYLLHGLLAVVERNMGEEAAPAGAGDTRIGTVIRYIHDHIADSAALRTGAIAAHAGISASYLGDFFRAHTGVTLRDYIQAYKQRQIEHRIRFSGASLKEIAFAFGFRDQSHFSKYFQQQRGMSPGAYREQLT